MHTRSVSLNWQIEIIFFIIFNILLFSTFSYINSLVFEFNVTTELHDYNDSIESWLRFEQINISKFYCLLKM